ncbi:MAG: hypothetical protein ACI8PB_002914 [Desulforhopalus sp.]|jgi:hypothetical protein
MVNAQTVIIAKIDTELLNLEVEMNVFLLWYHRIPLMLVDEFLDDITDQATGDGNTSSASQVSDKSTEPIEVTDA